MIIYNKLNLIIQKIKKKKKLLKITLIKNTNLEIL